MANLVDEAADIQGIIISGYGHLNYSCNFFLHIDDAAAAKAWLARLIPQVTTAKREKGPDGRAIKPDWALNVAFTYPGLAVLQQSAEWLSTFTQEFQQGMTEVHRSRRLGDVGGSAPELWEIGGRRLDGNGHPVVDKNEVHLVLMLETHTEEELNSLAESQRSQMQSGGLREVVEAQRGYMRPDHKEHFGFHDSIAEPEIEGSPKKSSSGQTRIQTGEFILGYRNSYNNFPATPVAPASLDTHDNLKHPEHDTPEDDTDQQKDFGRNGTYLVFRKLYQDVAAFRRYFRDNFSDPAESELMTAKCMGRWPSGTPLVLSPEKDDPALDDESANDFLYMETDPNGYICPIGAHIRRANPRDGRLGDPVESVISVNRHRIIRRGTPYGERLPEGVYEDDGKDRGLLFFVINTDIARQFEFIQDTWLNDPKFNSLYNDRDPIVGSNKDPARTDDKGPWNMTIQREPVRLSLTDIPRFVWVKGGAYFFLPSISALSFLAGIKNPISHLNFMRPIAPVNGGYMSSASHLQLAEEYPSANEEADIAHIAETLSQKVRDDYPPGKRALRDAHPKAHGTVKGEFIVHDNLPENCRHGVFTEPRTFPAWIRFSSTGLQRVEPDTKKDAHGMAIKMMGVEGEKLLEEEKNEQTQDFIMVNYDVFFIRNVHDFTFFAEALRDNRMLSFFFGWNPFKWRFHEFWRALMSISGIGNPLQIQYWSQTPTRLGPHAIKYSARSRMPHTDRKPRNAGPDFLTEAMVRQLNAEDVYFDFMIQFQTDPVRMPIEDPTIRWDEGASPFIKVATVHIPMQEFASPAQMEFGDNLSFTPWHALPAHRPLGGIQRARRTVYQTISKLRHGLNNAARKEPVNFDIS